MFLLMLAVTSRAAEIDPCENPETLPADLKKAYEELWEIIIDNGWEDSIKVEAICK